MIHSHSADRDDDIPPRPEPAQPEAARPEEAVAAAIASGMPLSAGLRAYAEDLPTGRTRRALIQISDKLEAGASLPDALAASQYRLPAHLFGLVNAGLRSGRLGILLEEYLLTLRRRRSLRFRAALLFLYPFVLALFAAGVGGLFFLLIMPQFKSMFEDFGIELPALTYTMITLSDLAMRLMVYWRWAVVPLIALAAFVWALRYLPGRDLRTRIYQALPAIGRPSRFAGMAEFCSLLGLLVDAGLPMDEALRCTATGISDPNLKVGARLLSESVARGRAMATAGDEIPHFSPGLVSLFRWEKQQAAFASGLKRSGEMFALQSEVHMGVLPLLLEPFVVFGVGLFGGFVVLSLFLPLIKLLNELS